MSKGNETKGFDPSADPMAEDEGNISSPKSAFATAAEEAEEIWTAAAMEAAQPYPMDVDEGALVRAVESMLETPEAMEAAEGGGGAEPGGRPQTVATSEETAAAAQGYSYPAPFTRFEVGKICPYSTYPYVTVGKLFFKQGGNSYVGSAASIGNYAIFTAGHCVHSGNGSASGWSTNVVFVPAYKNGASPFGQWNASYLTTRAKWYNNGIPNGLTEDMGGAVLHMLGGKKISQRVGWLGFSWGKGRLQHWHAIGYPAGAPFNGQLMWDTQASYAYDGTVAGIKPVGIGCDMTGGCSGGPWVRQFGSNNHLNGINSYRRTTKPKEMFSPYFDGRAKSLKDNLIAGTP